MESTASPQEPGGFLIQHGLPSPASSSVSTRSGTTGLPHPRRRALLPGSNKEHIVRRFGDERLMHISRRYAKKFSPPLQGDTITGFQSFGEVSRELEDLVNVLWKSGTPSLQIPFLLRAASDFTQYVRSFPPAPKATFRLLRKLDHCFASLMRGQDIASRESLPGFENGLRAGMTTTDMVRCRSIVEQTRVLMMTILSEGVIDQEEEEDDDEEDGGERTDEDSGVSLVNGHSSLAYDIDDEGPEMDAARIYENALVALGERLGDPFENRIQVDDSVVCSTA